MSIWTLSFSGSFYIIETDSRDYLKDNIEKRNRRINNTEGRADKLNHNVR
jgi:hypothetical protein